MTNQNNLKKRKRKFLFLLFFINVLGFLIYFFLKVSAISNFSINDSLLILDKISISVDQLPASVNFTSHSEKTASYSWKIYKNNDTTKYTVKSFDHSFTEIGNFIVELKAIGKKGKEDGVKTKYLKLFFSEKYKNNKTEIFENVFKKHIKSKYSYGKLIQDDQLIGVIDKKSLSLTYFDEEGNELSENTGVPQNNRH